MIPERIPPLLFFRRIRLWALLGIWAGLTACTNLRYLEDNQKLYTGHQLEIQAQEKIRNKSEVERQLNSVIRPEPNQKILFWRPRLWLYHIAGQPRRDRGIRHYIKEKLGRPPVLLSEVNPERTTRLIENRLHNLGFFDAEVSFMLREKPRKAEYLYQVRLRPAYTIDRVHWPEGQDSIIHFIRSISGKSLVRPGRSYNLENLRAERQRIDKELKNQGYFFFHADYLLFSADTTRGNRKMDLSLGIKPGTPPQALQAFSIRNITINTDYSLGAETLIQDDTVKLADNLFLFDRNQQFKPQTIQRALFFEPGQRYNFRDHDLSLNHLIGLGVFRFVNLRFQEVPDPEKALLDLRLLLSPMDKKSVSTELRAISKSNNFAGPGMQISFSNRNLLGGAEHFSLNLSGSFESLLGQRQTRASSLEAGVSAELDIPRFVAPFGVSNISPQFIPKTNISVAYNYLGRTDAFNVSSLSSQFGYNWHQSLTTRHRLYPFVFNLFVLGAVSEEYKAIFSAETLLRRGLFEQFLLGSEYGYFYNAQLKPGNRKHNWYFNLNTDFSGNLTYLLAKNVFGLSPGEQGELRIFNQAFAQYAKGDVDLRYYLNMGRGKRLATRFKAGLAAPYGNSTTLPYLKLFTAGGSDGIRAFHPRSLGPGAYLPPDTLSSSLNIYQTGEIKLEFNMEYRFDMTRIFKGAVFLDAGNIWNLKDKESTPGGQFQSNTFLNQMALGSGAGIRMDFTFFLLRLDLAFPLKVPYHQYERNWRLEKITPWDKKWRRDKLIFNLAIGYPF